MAQPTIIVSQDSDGFFITVDNKKFYFEFGETVEKLVDVFHELGFEAEYEDVY